MKGYTNCSSSSSTSFKECKINVTYTAGAICTITNGITTLTAPNTSGNYTFTVVDGLWEINCIDNNNNKINSKKIRLRRNENRDISLLTPYIFGIQRDQTNSSPIWTRINDSSNYVAIPSIGTNASNVGYSDFNDKPIYSQIQRETIMVGTDTNIMVKIPKFWFKRTVIDNIETIQITPSAQDGFELHPAFTHNNTTQEYIYVGAYELSQSVTTESGKTPATNTRATFRTVISNKGAGWGLIDISATAAIQMLILVEYANNNIQDVIGYGYAGGSDKTATGSCDSIPNLTGRNSGALTTQHVVWRGIEDFWGNGWDWTDGINYNNGIYYICNNQSQYSDSITSDYVALDMPALDTPSSATSTYIKTMGYDSNYSGYFLPIAGNATESTYYTDVVWRKTGVMACAHGGCFSDGTGAGLFAIIVDSVATRNDKYVTARSMYIPSQF